MRTLVVLAAFAGAMITTPAAAQCQGRQIGFPMPGAYRDGNPDALSGVSAIDSRTSGMVATTPTRLERSSREMNSGRPNQWSRRPTPMLMRRATLRALARGGLLCTPVELDMVAQLADGTPLVEVACQEGGGVVIADSTPVQASDCMDLINGRGQLGPCAIRRNVDHVEHILASRRSATN